MSAPVTITVGKKRVHEAREIMKQKGIHALPIIQYSKKLPEVEVTIKGIVTVTDLMENIDDNLFVEDIMTPNVFIIHKHSSAQAAAKMMLKKKVHHLVVMDEGKIVGMVSSIDFAKLVAEHSLG
jgi:CBS domain-containing protein